MLENSTAGLYLLDPALPVTVTGEEHHQHTLARYPATPAHSRRVAVELRWCTIASGKHRGDRAIEVHLDGHRVGELTHAMSLRYGPVVDAVLAMGSRPGCEATIARGERGFQIQLHLPRANAPLPTAPPPPYVPEPTTVAPLADRKAKKARVPLTFAGAVVGMIAVIAGIANSGDDDPAPGNASGDTTITITTSAVAPPPITTTTTTTVPTTTTTTTTRPTTTTTRPKPTTTTRPAPPPPAPKPMPQPDCDPNYSGCVPIASDVDCAGGSGNGPAYVRGPVRVTGTDIYDLDRDNDGLACE